MRLDLEDGSVVDTIKVGASPAAVAVGEGSVWVTNSADGTVSRINVEINEASQTLPAGSVPSGIAVGDGALWIADTVGAALLRVDPTSAKVEAVPLAGQPSGIALTKDGVWVSVAPGGVARIDPTELSVTLTKTVGTGPTAVLPAFDSIWVANHLDGTVTRLDPPPDALRRRSRSERARLHWRRRRTRSGLPTSSAARSARSTRPRTPSSRPFP